MWERIAEWGWSVVLLLIGGLVTLLTKWVSMLHKHEKQLALLEYDHRNRIETNAALLKAIAEANGRLEAHRKESLERMDALRRELRQDFQTLIEFHMRSEERDREARS